MNFEKKYVNRDILIIGGGTSTLDRKWENIISSEMFIWTCNDFYKNSRVVNQDIDLYQLAYTTDLSDSKLVKTLKEKRPFTYFETDYFRNKNTSIQGVYEIKETEDSEDASEPTSIGADVKWKKTFNGLFDF